MSRYAPLEMAAEEFRKHGHELVDQIAEFLDSLPNRPVTTGESPSKIQELIGTGSLPQEGSDAGELLKETARILFDHSLFNGHSRFWGYITSPPAPIGILADMLASTINPNVGGWSLSPVASEIEFQTIKWLAELIGYDPNCGGVLVSGGNMANITCFLAARKAKAGWDIGKKGMASSDSRRIIVYTSAETHTWINKGAEMCGLGSSSIRLIKTDSTGKLDISELRNKIKQDKHNGCHPIMVIGTAGSVSTGVVDPLGEIADVCKEHSLWYHIDGAYGAFAACLPDALEEFKYLTDADSIAVDPHKWLYAPIEAGCALVRDAIHLKNAFSFRPPYYKFDSVKGEETTSFVDYSLQNTRGFRALKVWLGLKHVGRKGYEKMIGDDISLSVKMAEVVAECPELEVMTQSLSIMTFRYAPSDFEASNEKRESYLNDLNRAILTRLQEDGELFVSNAIVNDRYLLRACIVNFRTNEEDVAAVPEIVIRTGKEIDIELRPVSL